MRLRAMSPTGDMTWGNGVGNFLINTPAMVAQLVMTRLNLWTYQWFLSFTEGTPYATNVLGKNTKATYDAAITQRILTTPGVASLQSYQSQLSAQRKLTWSATINTIFGPVSVTLATFVVPPSGNQLQDSSGNLLFDSNGNAIFGSVL